MTVSAGTRSATGRFFEQLVNRDALPMPTRKLTAMLHTYGNLTLIPVVIAVVMFCCWSFGGRAGIGQARWNRPANASPCPGGSAGTRPGSCSSGPGAHHVGGRLRPDRRRKAERV
jgi:hypothetical protein